MSQACSICNHPKRLSIDREIVEGKSHTGISRKYGVSDQSISSHAQNHLSRQLVQAWQKKELTESMNLLSRIEDVLSKAENIFNRNYLLKKDDLALRALSEQRSTIELLCKVAAYLHEARASELQSRHEDYESRRKEEEQERIGQALDRLNPREADLWEKLIAKINGADLDILPYYETKFPKLTTYEPKPLCDYIGKEQIAPCDQSSKAEIIEPEPSPYAVRPIPSEQIPGTKIMRKKLARKIF